MSSLCAWTIACVRLMMTPDEGEISRAPNCHIQWNNSRHGDCANDELRGRSDWFSAGLKNSKCLVRAAKTTGMPAVISFTVETDGRLPSGQTLKDAIEQVDAAADSAPVYYMIYRIWGWNLGYWPCWLRFDHGRFWWKIWRKWWRNVHDRQVNEMTNWPAQFKWWNLFYVGSTFFGYYNDIFSRFFGLNTETRCVLPPCKASTSISNSTQ